MKLKNSLFVFLALPFVATADDYVVTYTRYEAGSASVSNVDVSYSDISLEEAFEFSCQYIAPRLRYPNPLVTFPDQIGGCVSNVTTGVFYSRDKNPRYLFYQNTLQKIALIGKSKGWTLEQLQGGFTTVQNPTGFYKFIFFSPRAYCEMFFSQLTYNELVEFAYSLQSVPSDVAALVPSLDSHAATVSNLSVSLDREFHAVSNLQFSANSKLDTIASNTSDIYHQVYDINYALNSSSGLGAIFTRLDLLDPSTANPWYLGAAFASAYGMEGYPYEALVDSGLASDLYDAQHKISDPNWVHRNLPGAISSQIEKNALIQQFQRDGISPPAGTTFRNLGLQQLRNIASYSYNTPVSSNATLKAKSLEYLKHMNDTSDDINSGVQSLRDTLANPQEVIVLNWPNDFYGAANLSNLFADAIQGFQAAWTNFNPVYTWNDGTFFERSFYNWRGLNTLEFSGHGNPDQLEIGISSFSFSPTGNFFNDVPNLIALQGRVSMDVANMVGLVAAYTQTNLAAMSSTQSLENQYQEEFLQQATESLNEFSNALSSSNLLERNTHFIDTSSVFQTPTGFTEIFSGDHSIPSYINLQLPSWTFGQDDQSTPDIGSTITIETSQYATFFQNCRYVFLFLYWGITVMIMIWLFRLFSRFISWIPLSLTGGGSHDTVSI